MLDPALCDHPTSQWLVLKSMLSTWLMTPTLVLLPILALIGLSWMIPRLPWKRQLISIGTVLLLIYFTATLPLTIAVANKGLVAFLPADPGTNVDAIVVLGRGEKFRNSRIEVTAKLWKARRAPLIFASGAGDVPRMLQQLKAEGIPNQSLDGEQCSRTTEENAFFTAIVLQPQGIRRILLVTDPPHMLRAMLTFRSLGFKVIPHASPLPPDLALKKRAMVVFYEYMGLVSYSLQGKFLYKGFLEAKNPQTEILESSPRFLLHKDYS